MKLTLSQWLGLRRMTQAELAEKAGVTRVSINKYANGVTVPSEIYAQVVANALGIQPEEIEWDPEKLGELE